MKKLLSLLSVTTVFFSSFSTTACMFASNKEQFLIDKVNEIIDGSSIISRANIYSHYQNKSSNPNTVLLSMDQDDFNKILGTNKYGNTKFIDIMNSDFQKQSVSFNDGGKTSFNYSAMDLPTILNTLNEVLGTVKLPISYDFFETLTSFLQSSVVGQISDLIDPQLYDTTGSSFFNNNNLLSYSNFFKPLIPANEHLTYGKALNIAFYNLIYWLDKSLGLSDFTIPFSLNYYYSPAYDELDFSSAVMDIGKDINKFTFNISLLNALPSVFVILNYFSQFFNFNKANVSKQDNPDIYLMNNNELNTFNAPTNDTAFDYLFSKTKTNKEIIQEINNMEFKPGINNWSIRNMFQYIFSNLDNGVGLDRLLIMLTPVISNTKNNGKNYHKSRNYSSILNLILDLVQGLESTDPTTLSIIGIVEGILNDPNSTPLTDLERNFTINKFIDNFSTVIPSDFKNIINTITGKSNKHYHYLYAKESGIPIPDQKPDKWNNGSISSIWNDLSFTKEIISDLKEDKVNINLNLTGKNLYDAITNLLKTLNINISGTSINALQLLNIMVNVFQNLSTDIEYKFSSAPIYKLINDLTLNNDQNLYKKVRDQFIWDLKNDYDSSKIMKPKFNNISFEQLISDPKINIMNKSIFAYYLYEMEDPIFASGWENILGLDESTNSLKKNSFSYVLKNDLNTYQDFFNTGLISLANSIIKELINIIPIPQPIGLDIVSDPNNWQIENRKYIDPQINSYKLPNEINYAITYLYKKNGGIQKDKFNIKLNLDFQTGNFISNITIQITKI